MCAAASLTRNATSGATLSGCQKSKSSAEPKISPYAPSVIRVRAAGAIALQVTPIRAVSCATIWANAAMPAFAAP